MPADRWPSPRTVVVTSSPLIGAATASRPGVVEALDRDAVRLRGGSTTSRTSVLPSTSTSRRSCLVDNLMMLLGLLKGSKLGYQTDRYSHSLQSGTRAYRNDEPVDMVVAALLHDVADGFAPENHSERSACRSASSGSPGRCRSRLAATLPRSSRSRDRGWQRRKPERPLASARLASRSSSDMRVPKYVDEDACPLGTWVIKLGDVEHGLFQGYYYFHHHDGDRNAREMHKDSPYYDRCVDFCHEYDQNCFDPNYPVMDLQDFRPMLDEVFSRPGDGSILSTIGCSPECPGRGTASPSWCNEANVPCRRSPAGLQPRRLQEQCDGGRRRCAR